MKTLIQKGKYAAAVLAASFVSSVARAQVDINSINTMTSQVKQGANLAVNLVSVIIGLVAVIMLAWNYFKRAKGDGQSNDALASWGWGLIIVIIGLQVVKIVFINAG